MSKVVHRTDRTFENDYGYEFTVVEFPEDVPDFVIDIGDCRVRFEPQSKQQLKEILEYLGEVYERWEDE